MYKKNVIWIDADAIIEKEPILFKEISKSFAVHYINKKTESLFASVLFFKYNDTSFDILRDWIENNKIDKRLGDQHSLECVIEKKYMEHVYKLPKEYNTIFDHKSYNQKDRVISQWQSSRKLRYGKHRK